MTITINWWIAPTTITVLAVLWALFWPADDGGMFGGITRLFMMVPALFVAMLSWIVGAVLK